MDGAEELRDCCDFAFLLTATSRTTFPQARLLDPVLRVAHPVPMTDLAGLAVPRRTQASDLSHDESAFAWALLIESGHIPLRTRLGTCCRDLYRPLRLRFLAWLQRVAFTDLYTDLTGE